MRGVAFLLRKKYSTVSNLGFYDLPFGPVPECGTERIGARLGERIRRDDVRTQGTREALLWPLGYFASRDFLDLSSSVLQLEVSCIPSGYVHPVPSVALLTSPPQFA